MTVVAEDFLVCFCWLNIFYHIQNAPVIVSSDLLKEKKAFKIFLTYWLAAVETILESTAYNLHDLEQMEDILSYILS